jgi:Family of unknown function (DUF5678)
MSDVTFETIYRQVRQLPPEDQQRLIEAIGAGLKKKPLGKRVQPSVPYKDRSREHQWLRENSHNYIGQWLALDDGTLIAHGKVAKAVFAEAGALGYERPLVFFVPDPATPDPTRF